MGGKSGGNKEAAAARADEQARQERIRQGTKAINDTFDGATVGSGLLGAGTAFDPKATYYNADGSVWAPAAAAAPVSGLGSLFQSAGIAPASSSASAPLGGTKQGLTLGGVTLGGSGANAAAPAEDPTAKAFREAVAAGKIFSGTEKKAGFDEAFFEGRKKAYMDYANPQLEDQYGKAGNELTFALARGGNLNSSTRGAKLGELQQLYDLNKQKVADDALASSTQARTAVEDARSGLIATLNATGDAQGAANSALARSSALSQPAAYSPLGQLFTDFTSALGIQAAQERAAAASGGSYKSNYDTGLFGNAGRVSVRR